MPGRRVDLTGQRFGRLVVLEYVGNRHWLCQCDCGEQKKIRTVSFKSGVTVSCGCYMKEQARKRFTKHGGQSNGKRIPEYQIWDAMIQRCENPKSGRFKWYGGRGIKVCSEWRCSFEQFLIDMGHRPSSQYSIDRIDNNGNYEPGNCRWATTTIQKRNQGLDSRNISGCSGVWWHKKRKKWFTHIGVNGKRVYLGWYRQLEEAIKVRKRAEEEFWQER